MRERKPPQPKPVISKYGMTWGEKFVDELQIEFFMIRQGGYYVRNGVRYGEGLFAHYRAAQSLCWPEDDHHRWSDMLLRGLVEERITVAMGTRDSGKTHGISKFALIDYWVWPEETLSLMSSTGLRELELRVWGDIKDLFERATRRFEWLQGTINQANFGIFTDALTERGDIRDMRKGIICVPCIGGEGEWIGLDRFVGIKQKRRRIFGDEMQFMHVNYLNVLDAMDKGDFKGAFTGNPIAGNGKALDKVAEPKGGWGAIGEVTKTRTWRNRSGAYVINFVGTDSPNFDADRPKDYPYLINQEDIDRVVARSGRDSSQFWTLIMGVRKIGVDLFRVMTTTMCEKGGAYNAAVWAGGDRVRILAIDAGFGGGDPCETMVVEFGEDVNGEQVIEFSKSDFIPIELSSGHTPEDQIAFGAKAICDARMIPYSNVFFDAGMRATLGVSMAGILSADVNAINFGGPATDRPVSDTLFYTDPKTGERRLIKCVEQYSKFVTELWFTVRAIVEAGQARSMPQDCVEQFSMREWEWVPGPIGMRYELETKPEYKTRMGGESPNKADVASIAVEGARRRGFTVKDPKAGMGTTPQNSTYLQDALDKHRKFTKKRELSYR